VDTKQDKDPNTCKRVDETEGRTNAVNTLLCRVLLIFKDVKIQENSLI
jgi:hypothetical protein